MLDHDRGDAPALRHLWLEVTGRCNFSCSHCYADSGPTRGHGGMSGSDWVRVIDVPEGTLYPLMLRLAKDGLISSRLADGDGGAPRKYYALTSQGRELLRGMIPSWSKLAASVDSLLTGASA